MSVTKDQLASYEQSQAKLRAILLDIFQAHPNVLLNVTDLEKAMLKRRDIGVNWLYRLLHVLNPYPSTGIRLQLEELLEQLIVDGTVVEPKQSWYELA